MYVLFVQTLAAYCHHTATMIADSASSSYPCLQQGQSLNRELLNALVTKVNKKMLYMQSIVPIHYIIARTQCGYCIMVIFMLPVDLVIPSTGS